MGVHRILKINKVVGIALGKASKNLNMKTIYHIDIPRRNQLIWICTVFPL